MPPRAAGWYVAEPDRDRFGKEHCMSDEQGDHLPTRGEAGAEGSGGMAGPIQAGVAVRSKGQSLVEAFRQARVKQRPALRTDLRDSRVALHQSRLQRLGRRGQPASLQHGEQAAAGLPSAAAEAPNPEEKPEASSSIFATFCVAPETPPVVKPCLDEAPALVEASQMPAAPPDAGNKHDEISLPLSAIGFGPGMTIRMGQLGIETVSQLAAADPVWLRTSLGDLSQLVHAELWIATARKACADQA